MVTDGTKKPQVSVPTPPPPWKINLQKYAESCALKLHSLQSIIENRVNSDYRSQKNKRRTTVFDNQIARKGCRRKRQKLGIIDKALAKSGLEENHQKKLPRCVHRRYELKKNPENGFCYDQALGLPPSFVSTRKDSLMSVLRMVLEPYPATTPHPGNHDDSVLYSVTYGRAMMEKRVISINCFSLEGQLAKLELIGLGTFQLLQKVLHAVGRELLAIEETCARNSSILRNEDYFSSCAMLSLNVKDPRELPWKKTVVPVESISTKTPTDAQEKKYKELAELGGILEENRDLSSLSRGLRPPVEDSFLSKEKHHERMVNFCLDDIHSGEANSSTKPPGFLSSVMGVGGGGFRIAGCGVFWGSGLGVAGFKRSSGASPIPRLYGGRLGGEGHSEVSKLESSRPSLIVHSPCHETPNRRSAFPLIFLIIQHPVHRELPTPTSTEKEI
ncbi:hypothetical protein JHK82_046161 [Glycine max]|nr:hypothetical protein JHK82_046161 [Glycine max]